MICTPDVSSSSSLSPLGGSLSESSVGYSDGSSRRGTESSETEGMTNPSVLPQYAKGLMSAVDEAWSNLSVLAKCASHKELCAIAGARIAKELHKRGATTGADAFESFKSCYERFTPSPNTLVEIPIPEDSGAAAARVATTGTEKSVSSSFQTKFEVILNKIQWSPSGATGTSRPSLPSTTMGKTSVTSAAVGIANKRPIESVNGRNMDVRYDVKRIRS
jgi:hypothetical protein